MRQTAEEEGRRIYEEPATEEWLEALEPVGTDPEKPFLLLVTGFPAGDATVPEIGKKSLEEIANFL